MLSELDLLDDTNDTDGRRNIAEDSFVRVSIQLCFRVISTYLRVNSASDCEIASRPLIERRIEICVLRKYVSLVGFLARP